MTACALNNGVEIIASESLGVRGLCCLVQVGARRIVIDPGLALGYWRHGLLPHPRQVVEGERVRERIIQALATATDVVFSHFHGDHVPLCNANPYQLAIDQLPANFGNLRVWSKSDEGLSAEMMQRANDLKRLFGEKWQLAEGRSDGVLSFSPAVPHGRRGSNRGTVMMTRVELGAAVFVHASDIQLLDAATIDFILDWRPDIVLAAGPPLYLERLNAEWRAKAWDNALVLAAGVKTLILDHHLLRDLAGLHWLEALSQQAGKPIYCAADYMNRQRLLLEARRVELYAAMPLAED